MGIYVTTDNKDWLRDYLPIQGIALDFKDQHVAQPFTCPLLTNYTHKLIIHLGSCSEI